MIFCGDTVFPFYVMDINKIQLEEDFVKTSKIVNLESLIISEKVKKITKGIALNSSLKIVDFLQYLNVKAVSLANNHITDFDVSIDAQKDFLFKYNINSFGAGDNISSAQIPFFYEENGKKVIVVSFGWDVIGCKYATNSSKGVNPMEYKHIFSQLENIKNRFKNYKIIFIFHNNYEFELYPQPAHRKLFFDLIDKGVNAIFCHHPHIVGGVEIYKNSPIFYSLGNFYLPEQNYNGYILKYNDEAKIGLCANFTGDVENIMLYWTYKDEKNNLRIIQRELLKNSNKIKKLTPFAGLSHKEYIKWFKINRKKRKFLPIYKNYKSNIEIIKNNLIVKYRQNIIDFLVRKGIK